jgi:ubiquinol-cytochrome c reductase cytochrome b subunit
VTRRLLRWFDDSLGASRFARTALNKIFPDHWSFMVGEIALYSFVILVLTGTYLSFFFVPSVRDVTYQGHYAALRGVHMSEAYRSTLDITFQVRAGLVMRQMHHWAAIVFIGAIVVHLCRVFFTGAFRRPRQLNWMVGVALLILAIVNGFAGYSLPDDLLSGTGLRIAYSISLSIPLLGVWAAFLFFGGKFPATSIISRLFVIHIFVIPALIAALLAAHLAIMWHQKHTQFAGPGRPRRPGPDQSHLAVRPVPPRAGELGIPTRLVHGLARGGAADHAPLGDARLWLRASQPLLSWRPSARYHLRSAVRLAVLGRAL